jgi:hypothetical protein
VLIYFYASAACAASLIAVSVYRGLRYGFDAEINLLQRWLQCLMLACFIVGCVAGVAA